MSLLNNYIENDTKRLYSSHPFNTNFAKQRTVQKGLKKYIDSLKHNYSTYCRKSKSPHTYQLCCKRGHTAKVCFKWRRANTNRDVKQVTNLVEISGIISNKKEII